MEPVRKTILYDDDKRPAYVVIAYEDWQRIESLLGKPNGAALGQFFGLRTVEGDPVEIQRRFRDEWPD